MNKKKLGQYRKLLNERLDVLVNEATKTMTDMTGEEENFPDPTDRASVESDRNFLLRIRDRERKLIVKIREALDRIDKGTYGICEECGEEISEQRLLARPVTELCIECKTSQEEDERRRGE
jgi:DnaK suppressor protein